jgi:hypothetical protein
LLVACGWLVGCGDSKFDQVTSGAGCRADDTLPGLRGWCPNEQLACELGWIGRDDVSANGCEAALLPTNDYALFALHDGGVASLTLNDYELGNDVTGGWVAMAGPACKATMSAPCSYDLVALQVAISDFMFDSLSWTDGLLELAQPLPMTDRGEGLMIPNGTPFVASFTIEGKKRVVSQGTLAGAIQVAQDGTTLTLTGQGLRLPFGGCTVDRLTLAAAGAPVTAP